MKWMKISFFVCVSLLLGHLCVARAQDDLDMDLESLLGDLDDPMAEEFMDEEAVDVADSVVEEEIFVLDDDIDFDDMDVASLEETSDPVMDEDVFLEDVLTEVEPVAEDMGFQDDLLDDMIADEPVVSDEGVDASGEAMAMDDTDYEAMAMDDTDVFEEVAVESSVVPADEDELLDDSDWQALVLDESAVPLTSADAPPSSTFGDAYSNEAVPMSNVELDDVFADVELKQQIPPARVTTVPAPGVVPAPAKNVTISKPVSPKVSKLNAEEEVRRQALEVEGQRYVKMGTAALAREDYAMTIQAYTNALVFLPDRRANERVIANVKNGLAEANYQLARQYYRAKNPDYKKAQQHIANTLIYLPDNKAAKSLQDKINKAVLREERLAKLPKKAAETPSYVERVKSVKELFAQGKDFYNIGEYDMAEQYFEKVLVADPYNTTAMRYLRKIAEKRNAISTVEFGVTRKQAIANVRKTWSPELRDQVKLPTESQKVGAAEKISEGERLRNKMSSIIIPKIEFRDANIQDVVEFLSEASRLADPEKTGVNIVLNMKLTGGTSQRVVEKTVVEDDDFGFGDGFDDMLDDTTTTSEFSSSDNDISLTLSLHRISLMDAVKTITDIAGLRYRIDGNIIIISPPGVVQGQVVTKMYPVQPSIFETIIERDNNDVDHDAEFVEMGGRGTKMARDDVKVFFEKAGVAFPKGTSITYNPMISQLIVANTQENLEVFERILAQLNVIPNQVEIEARFIEIGETDLSELGLEWILNDNWEVATKQGSGSLASRERVQVDADDNGFTQGLRFWDYSSGNGALTLGSAVTRGSNMAMGGIMSISSILTNPELSVVLHALDQNGGSDLLSAPRVTTRSGYNAVIQVVQEIIYPTEFEAQSQSVEMPGDNNRQTVVVVTPGGFQTREVGVILNVTPTVGPDGYTIDLAMVPEVSELVRWIEYGSAVGDIQYHMPQPVFSSRNVTTSIVIWDGQTVVMGGLIRESLTTVNDKIPLLGDIPFLGRLFRNEGEYSEKKNLLIFVTARLVDPAGRPIHKKDSLGTMPGSDVDEADES
ncbi:MAG: hypothetical protein EOL87_07800 [Spartobacteria bacterium]|nr:hypothetical protein [Spartobacteria bacterium]